MEITKKEDFDLEVTLDREEINRILGGEVLRGKYCDRSYLSVCVIDDFINKCSHLLREKSPKKNGYVYINRDNFDITINIPDYLLGDERIIASIFSKRQKNIEVISTVPCDDELFEDARISVIYYSAGERRNRHVFIC